MQKPLTVWITINCGKFWRKWEYQTTWPASLEICVQVRKQQLEIGHGTTDWFQTGKGIHQGCILSPCLFNLCAEYIMRNAGLDEVQARIKIVKRNINNLRYADIHHPNGRKWRGTKEPLDESERRKWKSWLKTQYSILSQLWALYQLHSSFTENRDATTYLPDNHVYMHFDVGLHAFLVRDQALSLCSGSKDPRLPEN